MSRKFVILGTAGHVDHGKTALVEKLTGINTDRWEEERRRGMTIDIGFANLEFPQENILVGIIDVPGHEKFIKNMLSGAHGIDIVLLVIAADEGVMPQTKEHLTVCEMLNIKSGIVAITKTDLVEKDWLELVREEVKEFLKGTFLENAPIVYVSSKTGEGIKTLKEEILKKALNVTPRSAENIFRLPVDRSFIIKGFGTVVTGTVLSGKIKTSDIVTVYPTGQKVKVRNIQRHGKQVNEACAGQRAALNLSDISKESIKRGYLISIDGLTESKLLDATVRISKRSDYGLKNGETVHFHYLTSETEAKIFLISTDSLAPGEESFARIKLAKPLITFYGDRFIIRHYATSHIIGGGVILNPLPQEKFRRKFKDIWIKKLSTLKNQNIPGIIELLSKDAGKKGLPVSTLYQFLHSTDIENAVKSCESCIMAGERIYHHNVVSALTEEAKNIVRNFHKTYPPLPGINKESLKTKLSVNDDLFSIIHRQITSGNEFCESEGTIKSADFAPHIKGTLYEKSFIKIKKLIEGSMFKPPDVKEIPKLTGTTEEEASIVIAYLISQERFVKIDGFLLSRKHFDRLMDMLCKHFSRHQTISIAEFKNYTNATRKHVIPLLEFLDREGILKRKGNERIKGEKLTCK